MAPARAAFRPRPKLGFGGRLALAGWRTLTVLCYAVTLLGLGALAYSTAINRSEQQRSAGQPERSRPRLTFRPTVEEQEVAGQRWVIPRGWRALPGSQPGSVVAFGPDGARLEVLSVSVPDPTDYRRLAQECVGRRSARLALGGLEGFEFLDVRLEDADGIRHVRCMVRGGRLFRGTAPWATFGRENMGEWLLLMVLNEEWQPAVAGAESPADAGAAPERGPHGDG
jgi:hypothetical protein